MESEGWAGASEMEEKNVSLGRQHGEGMERASFWEVESWSLEQGISCGQ